MDFSSADLVDRSNSDLRPILQPTLMDAKPRSVASEPFRHYI